MLWYFPRSSHNYRQNTTEHTVTLYTFKDYSFFNIILAIYIKITRMADIPTCKVYIYIPMYAVHISLMFSFFVRNINIHAIALDPMTLYDFKLPYTAWCRRIIGVKMLWLAKKQFLHQHVLTYNAYVLKCSSLFTQGIIPVIYC